MSTSLLVPGAHLPVSGKPFGDTPAVDIDNLHKRMRRKARNAILALPVLCAVAFSIFWHVGQPVWGNWPKRDARETSQDEYVNRGVRCSPGFDYQLLLTGMGLGFPVSCWALFTFVAIRRLRRVVRLGARPWQAVTGTVRTSLPSSNGLLLALTLAVSGAPDVEVRFGLKGIGFFPLPAAGSTFTLHLAGNGGRWVLVGIPGHWGASVGTIRSLPAHEPAAE